ncbi:hypothetical protein Fmac_008312 [Flemingia macrophylla]|uniref:Uncharacterized protein n=1 Tax=Flemingia macrophylla TaxID=520843 RepID=A0ABD1MX15_9FABA
MMIGIVGIALTIGFSWLLSIFGLLGYTIFGGCPRSWTGFSAEAFVGLWDFFKLAIASWVMLSSEFGVVSLSCRRVEKNFDLHLVKKGEQKSYSQPTCIIWSRISAVECLVKAFVILHSSTNNGADMSALIPWRGTKAVQGAIDARTDAANNIHAVQAGVMPALFIEGAMLWPRYIQPASLNDRFGQDSSGWRRLLKVRCFGQNSSARHRVTITLARIHPAGVAY